MYEGIIVMLVYGLLGICAALLMLYGAVRVSSEAWHTGKFVAEYKAAKRAWRQQQ